MSESQAPAWTEETARWYAENYGDWPTNRVVVGLAELQSHDTVLDIGCGTGSALRVAASLVSGVSLIGVEPTPEMLRIAKVQSPSTISLLAGGAEDLPVDDGAVTVALAISTLHHWSSVPRGFSEVYRVLTPGGRLLIAQEDVEETGQHPDVSGILDQLREAGFVQVQSTSHTYEGPQGPIRMVLIEARII